MKVRAIKTDVTCHFCVGCHVNGSHDVLVCCVNIDVDYTFPK